MLLSPTKLVLLDGVPDAAMLGCFENADGVRMQYEFAAVMRKEPEGRADHGAVFVERTGHVVAAKVERREQIGRVEMLA